jgi:DNA-binding HxlR family transcriptional regulator
MPTIVTTSGLAADAYCDTCPTRAALDRIAGKWTVLIVDLLGDGTKRFSELYRRIGGISQKMLTQTLRELEADGYVTRTVFATVPPRVDYALTPLGRSLHGLMTQVRDWAETHINEVLTARTAHAQRSNVDAVG